MTKSDGGPAFPFWPDKARLTEDGRVQPLGGKGMSRRDWFAGQALAGMLNSKALAHLNPSAQAEIAFRFADAMLAESAK